MEDMPTDVLIHILSLVDVRTARITSVLSKRWEFLWSELPSLEFINESDTDALNFVSWVNRTIHIREGKYLEKFMVNFHYDKSFATDVDSWVEYSVKNKVKYLILKLSTSRDEYYTPPQVMYSCSSLTTLNLRGCSIMGYEGTIEWQSLTDLNLENVVLNQHLLYKILSSCPNLETLFLDGFKIEGELADLDGDLLHLRKITLNNCADPNGEPLLTLVRILLIRARVLEKMVIVFDVLEESEYLNLSTALLFYRRSSPKAGVYMPFPKF